MNIKMQRKGQKKKAKTTLLTQSKHKEQTIQVHFHSDCHRKTTTNMMSKKIFQNTIRHTYGTFEACILSISIIQK